MEQNASYFDSMFQIGLYDLHPRSLALYLNSKQIPGFRAASKSWMEAWGVWLTKMGQGRAVQAETLVEQNDELLLTLCEAECRNTLSESKATLMAFSDRIGKAAKRGDIDFFLRLAKAIKPAKRGSIDRKTLADTGASYLLMTRWLHSGLWLMSDDAGSIALSALVGRTITEPNYSKTRQRLGLVGWEVAHSKPIVLGYMPKTRRFRFAPGWEDMDEAEWTAPTP